MTTFASRRLADHFAEWVHADGGRVIGVKFLCPTCPQVEGAPTLAVLFANPPDGGPAHPNDPSIVGNNDGKRWQRTGDALETMTLAPSVDCSKCGHWHGFVRNGATE